MKKINPNLESRKKIYNFINSDPGLHIRDISRKMKISKIILRYLSRYLEKNIDYYIRFYIIKNFVIKCKKLIDFQRNKTTDNILLIILCHTVLSRYDMHPSTISKQLDRLLAKGFTEIAPVD